MQILIDEVEIVGCIPDQAKLFFNNLTCNSREVNVWNCRIYIAQDWKG